MAFSDILHEFQDSVTQCDSLIANSHGVDAVGNPILPPRDREQIAVAAFLNMYKAWEAFLEAAIIHLMIGGNTLSGRSPTKYVSPLHSQAAQAMIVGVLPYFDYANHDRVKTIVNLYFHSGYPFEPHFSAIFSDLGDLRTIRNASAHISSTTQTSLESLALRVFGAPRIGITLYQLLTAVDPRSPIGETVFAAYRTKLLVTAELIARG